MVSTRNSDRRALIFTYRTYYQSFSRLGTRMSQDLSHQSTTKRILSYEHSTCDTCLSVTSGGTWSYDRKLEYSWTRTLQRSWSICSMVHHSFTNMKYVIHTCPPAVLSYYVHVPRVSWPIHQGQEHVIWDMSLSYVLLVVWHTGVRIMFVHSASSRLRNIDYR